MTLLVEARLLRQLLNLEKINDSSQIQLNKEQFLGKEIIATGRTKKNKLNNQLEIIARNIEEPNVINEIKNTLEKFD